jgi:2-dehydro-3-deoxy-D-gluconate 5-dehydrogenase
MDLELDGLGAIVTGASRGLGRAAALALAAEGVRVLAVARSARELNDLEGQADGLVVGLECDLRDIDEVASLPSHAVNALGRLDIIVNNAGVAPAAAFLETTDDDWREVFDLNVFAGVALARAAGVVFVQQQTGNVINIASTAGILGKPTLVSYSASKGAVLQFTKALAAEWARHGIRVNAIAPGAFATAAQSAVLSSEQLLERRLKKIPLGRMGVASEVGPLTCFLASPLTSYITGAVFVTDGGESAKL